MPWRDIRGIPWWRRQGLLTLWDAGVFGWFADHRREYRMMEGLVAVCNTVARTASKHNKPSKLVPFHKLFPSVDRMMRKGISRAAMTMENMRRAKRDNQS